MRSVPLRRRFAGAAGLAAVGGAIAFNELVVRTGPPAALPVVLVALVSITAVTALGGGWLRGGRSLEAAGLGVAASSILLSLTHYSGDTPREAIWLLAEMGAVLLLLVAAVRLSPARWAMAGGAALAAAQLVMILRVATPAGVAASSGAALMWASGAVSAIGLGLYLRFLDYQRARSVTEARRAQRLELARDLHDFVAHDVTGMVVQAQAAQLVARRDPAAAVTALRRVEAAGLHALGSLDRTVRMLGELAQPADAPIRGARLADIAALARRFAAGDGTPVELAIDRRLEPALPAPVADAMYRVVLEALTNVRRHAPSATRVVVRIERREAARGAGVTVEVRDESPAGSGALPRGTGSGLIALRERVESLGGSFHAGPLGSGEPAGWIVGAAIPLPAGEGAR
ncbi:MAG: sensor histidine kinase [Gemmatimonadota bacterium]